MGCDTCGAQPPGQPPSQSHPKDVLLLDALSGGGRCLELRRMRFFFLEIEYIISLQAASDGFSRSLSLAPCLRVLNAAGRPTLAEVASQARRAACGEAAAHFMMRVAMPSRPAERSVSPRAFPLANCRQGLRAETAAVTLLPQPPECDSSRSSAAFFTSRAAQRTPTHLHLQLASRFCYSLISACLKSSCTRTIDIGPSHLAIRAVCLTVVLSSPSAFVIYSFLSLCFAYLGGESVIVHDLQGESVSKER